MKTIRVATVAALLASSVAFAQPKADGHGKQEQIATSEPVDGEVRRVNKELNKITLRHGELKGLDMPPMTMVFIVRDPTLLDRVKVGDRVKFVAEKATNGEFVVTRIEPVK